MIDDVDILSEEIERSALASLHTFCPAGTRAAQGLELVEVADGLVACCRKDPSILLNRTLGLGTREPVSADTLATVADAYASRGIDNYFIHVYEDTLEDSARDLLDSGKFVRKRGWMKFRNDSPAPREVNTDLRVELIDSGRSEDFGRIVCGAFGMAETSIPVLAGLAGDERWYLFVTYDGDTPAGAGALFMDNQVGWLEWGATAPEFRRRGSQGAIMAARLRLAAERGCRHVFTETGEAVQGDPQHSYGNIQKAGFRESVLRANYGPAPG